ncbi:hypothetical protein [Phreatobacter cathodiphilus]|uniref:Uncharacterized protein n=1 Tax=Phreatobacter cathodiphilus TaxID=1868589 RepID=A0A2S0N6L7_9HYPH|nr:hypothetical protein [Phreatobacter cathodiphilus]AVO43804.1 hypothetical protein C6569_01225 [Phreatobacter cathodiphilus]
MAQSLTAIRSAAVEDPEVEAVLAEFDGDPRRAIRALLDDIAALAEDEPAETVLTLTAAILPEAQRPG